MTPDNKLAVTRVWVNFAKAIAAYEYTLISRESAFDTFVADGSGSDGDLARRQARRAAVRRQGVVHRLPQRTAVLRHRVPRHRRAAGG